MGVVWTLSSSGLQEIASWALYNRTVFEDFKFALYQST